MFPGGGLPSRCEWQRCPSAAGPSSCWVWRLAQLHIIRRPWMEDSKVWGAAGRTRIITRDWPAQRFTHYPPASETRTRQDRAPPAGPSRLCAALSPGRELHPGREGSYVLISSVSLAPHSSALMAGTPTSVTPTQPVGSTTPSVGSQGDGSQRRTCSRAHKRRGRLAAGIKGGRRYPPRWS